MSTGRLVFFGSSLAMRKRILPVKAMDVLVLPTTELRGLAAMPLASSCAAMPSLLVVPPTR